MRARDVMTGPAVTVGTATPVTEALRILAEHGFTALPVVDDAGRLAGIATEADLVPGRVPPAVPVPPPGTAPAESAPPPGARPRGDRRPRAAGDGGSAHPGRTRLPGPARGGRRRPAGRHRHRGRSVAWTGPAGRPVPSTRDRRGGVGSAAGGRGRGDDRGRVGGVGRIRDRRGRARLAHARSAPSDDSGGGRRSGGRGRDPARSRPCVVARRRGAGTRGAARSEEHTSEL